MGNQKSRNAVRAGHTSSRVGTSRAAPVVAGRNRAAARDNIVAKLRTILAAVQLPDLAVERLATLPRTPRQFHNWSAAPGELYKGLPDVRLRTNARATLADSEDLAGQLDEVLLKLKEATGGKRLSSREERIANYQAKLALSEKLRRLAEARLCDALEELEGVRDELRRSLAARNSISERANEEFRDLERLLQSERDKVAELTKLLSKVTRLKERR